MIRMPRCERETIINYNLVDEDAIVYTRDYKVMNILDKLVLKYPEDYKCISKTDIDKTYSFPKKYIAFRKPIELSDGVGEKRRKHMEGVNQRE